MLPDPQESIGLWTNPPLTTSKPPPAPLCVACQQRHKLIETLGALIRTASVTAIGQHPSM